MRMAPPEFTDTMTNNTNGTEDGMDYEMEQATTPAAADMSYGHAQPDIPQDTTYTYEDMGYGDAQPDGHSDSQGDLGYEDMGYGDAQPDLRYEEPDPDHQPLGRRGSMSRAEEKQRRASIKAILADKNQSPMTKRRSIQHLMDGRRASLTNSITSASHHSGSTDGVRNGAGINDMGYEDTESRAQNSYDGQPCCDEHTKRAENGRPPCSHYQRQCTIIAPCCGGAFGCRICHDECPILPPKVDPNPSSKRRYNRSASLPSSFTSMGHDTTHTIDRFATKEVICRECYTRQSSKTNNCINCGIQFGQYHCSICNLWMSDEESPFHCSGCGFCRVGGVENFLHCEECGMCIDRNLFANHNCKAGKYQSDCPVCQEYLFSSRSASHEMPCGHAIHWDCFRQLAAHDSRCPICKKTAETRERMMPTWNAMAQGIALQPVPPDLCRVVNITCNDCEKGAEAQAWHFLGVQCLHCQSFNTVVDQIVLTGEEAHEFLEMNAFRAAINEARANGETPRRRRVNRRRSAM